MSEHVPIKLEVNVYRNSRGWYQVWLSSPKKIYQVHIGIHRTNDPTYHMQFNEPVNPSFHAQARMVFCGDIEIYTGGYGSLDGIGLGETKVFTLVEATPATVKPKRVYRKRITIKRKDKV